MRNQPPWRRWKFFRFKDLILFPMPLFWAGWGVYAIAVAPHKPAYYGPMGGGMLVLGVGLAWLYLDRFDGNLRKRWRNQPNRFD
jgi:4-amino-4-deoxy-L-arabinose transferase-like glycosyltransferase